MKIDEQQQQQQQQRRRRRRQQLLQQIILGIVVVATATLNCFPSATAFVPSSLLCHTTTPQQISGLFSVENDGTDLEDENVRLVVQLQEKLVYIQALEERNKAQIDSFVDEEHQWESMEEYERELLSSKDDIEKQLDELLAEE